MKKPVIIPAQQGSILLAFVLMLPFLLIISALYMQLTVSSLSLARRDAMQTQAQLATDAGVDYAMQQVNQNGSWAGTGSELELQPLTNGARTTYEVSVADTGDNEKTVTSTGRSYRGSSSTPAATVTVDVKLRGVSTGSYSIVSGVGGLVMRNSAKVVNGSVYVNGNLTMSNTAQIGLAILPVDVKVAHQSCPIGGGTTYPVVCGSGNGQPITMNNSAHIYGDVQATNQTNGSGMTNNGLVAGTPPAVPLPDYDRAAQKAAVNPANDMTGAEASCSLGTKTWPANTKITGDVTVSIGCIVTVEGNVWITGNLRTQNLGIIKVQEGLSTPPVIMVDGTNGLVMRNASVLLPNLNLVGFRIITYANATGNPDADITGDDLYDSKDMVTIDIDNAAAGAQTEFYARWSKLTAGNSGAVGALAAQTVELKNSIAVTFGTSVSGFGDTIWVIDSYNRQF